MNWNYLARRLAINFAQLILIGGLCVWVGPSATKECAFENVQSYAGAINIRTCVLGQFTGADWRHPLATSVAQYIKNISNRPLEIQFEMPDFNVERGLVFDEKMNSLTRMPSPPLHHEPDASRRWIERHKLASGETYVYRFGLVDNMVEPPRVGGVYTALIHTTVKFAFLDEAVVPAEVGRDYWGAVKHDGARYFETGGFVLR